VLNPVFAIDASFGMQSCRWPAGLGNLSWRGSEEDRRKVTVEMEVKSVGRGKSGVYFLNSGPNYRSDFNFTIH